MTQLRFPELSRVRSVRHGLHTCAKQVHTQPDKPSCPSNDASSSSVGIGMNTHGVPNKNFYAVQPHFSRQVCDYLCTVFKLNTKERIRQRLRYNSFDGIFTIIAFFTHGAGSSLAKKQKNDKGTWVLRTCNLVWQTLRLSLAVTNLPIEPQQLYRQPQMEIRFSRKDE